MALISQRTTFSNRYMPPMLQTKEEEDEEDIIVKQVDLDAGRLMYESTKAENFARMNTSQPTQFNFNSISSANRGVATELGDPNIEKDAAWYDKVLKVLEPLKYLEIPAELGMELVEWKAKKLIGGIPGVDADGAWWGEGTAPRESMQGWKALLKDDPNRSGWDEVKGRLDGSFEAFDNRPLMMQLGLGAVQIAATMGAGAIAKGAAVAGAKGGALAAARAARAGAYVIDPWELVYKGVKATRIFQYSWKGTKAGIKLTRSLWDNGRSTVDEVLEAANVQIDPALRAASPTETLAEVVADGAGMWSINTLEDALSAASKILGTKEGITKEDPQLVYDVITGFVKEHAARFEEHGLRGIAISKRFTEKFHIDVDTTLFDPVNVNIHEWLIKDVNVYGLGPRMSRVPNVLDDKVEKAYTTPDPTRSFKDVSETRVKLQQETHGAPIEGVEGAAIQHNYLSPALESRNTIQKFIRARYLASTDNSLEISERVAAIRDATILQTQMSIGARKNHSFRADKKALLGSPHDPDLVDLKNHNRLLHWEKEITPKTKAEKAMTPEEFANYITERKFGRRSAGLVLADGGVTQYLVQKYEASLIQWSKQNKDLILRKLEEANRTLDITDPQLAARGDMSEAFDADPLSWIRDSDQLFTFDITKMDSSINTWFRNDEVIEAFTDMGKEVGEKGAKKANNASAERLLAAAREELGPDGKKLYNNLPTDSSLIRNIFVASELAAGKSHVNIERQLKHGNPMTTAGYDIAIMDYNPAGSNLHASVELAKEAGGLLRRVYDDVEEGTNIDFARLIDRLVKESAKTPHGGSQRQAFAKGQELGGAEYASYVTRLGLSMSNSAAGRKILERYYDDNLTSLLTELRGGVDYHDVAKLDRTSASWDFLKKGGMAENLIALDAVVKYAQDLQLQKQHLNFKKGTLYKNIGSRKAGEFADKPNLYIEAGEGSKKARETLRGASPGILNRAGFFTARVSDETGQIAKAGETGRVTEKMVWAGDHAKTAKGKIYWEGRLDVIKQRLIMDNDNFADWDISRWKEWAAEIFDQRGHIETVEDMFRSMVRKKDGSWTSRAVAPLDEALLSFADDQSYHLLGQWDMMWDGVKNFEGVDAFRKVMQMQAMNPLSREGKQGGWSPFRHTKSNALKEFQKNIKTSHVMNGLWRTQKRIPMLVEDVTGQAHYEEGIAYTKLGRNEQVADHINRLPTDKLREWAAEPDVLTVLREKGLHSNISLDKAKEIIFGIAQDYPRLLGDDFAGEYAKLDFARGKMSHPLNQWLRLLSERVYNHRNTFEATIQQIDGHRLSDDMLLPPRLKSARDKSFYHDIATDMYGNGAKTIAGNEAPGRLGAIISTMGEGPWGKRLSEWAKKDVWYAKTAKNLIMAPVNVAFYGGQGGLAHAAVKAISARAGEYDRITGASDRGRSTLQDHGESALGLVVDAPNAAHLEAARRLEDVRDIQGMEHFTKLELQDTPEGLKRIRELEESEEGIRMSQLFVTGAAKGGGKGKPAISTKATPLKYAEAKWKQEMEPTGTGIASDIRKLFQTPDMPLDRIPEKFWHIYYKDMGTTIYVNGQAKFVPSKLYKDLVLYRATIDEIEYQQRLNGIDPAKESADRGGRYNPEAHAPRVYQMLGEAGEKSTDYLESGHTKHFKPRIEEDIIDIYHAYTVGGGTDALRGIADRIAIYSDSGRKSIIDKQAQQWIRGQAYTKEAYSIFAKRAATRAGLKGLRELVNERKGMRTPDGSYIQTEGSGSSIEALNKWAKQDPDLDMFGLKINDFLDGSYRSNEFWHTNADKLLDQIDSKLGQLDTSLAGRHSLLGQLNIDWIRGTHLSSLSNREQKMVKQYLVKTTNIFTAVPKIAADTFSTPNRLMRYFKSGIDIGAPMIHGWNALIRTTTGDKKAAQAWYKGTKMMGQMWLDPKMYHKYQAENIGVLNEASGLGGVRLSQPEPLWAADDKAVLFLKQNSKKIAKTLGIPETAVLGRFEDSFSGFLDVLRSELWQSMKMSVDDEILTLRTAAGKAGKNFDAADITNKKYRELGSVINKMTGAFDPHMVRQTPLQAHLESTLIFFAPMYRRATYSIMGDLFRFKSKDGSGGMTSMRQRAAFRQMTALVTAGAMMQQLAVWTGNGRGDMFEDGEITGADDALDLTSRFGKMHIAGAQIGFGGAWFSAFRLASDLAMNLTHSDKNQAEDKHWSESWVFDLLQRRGRSQSAPIMGLFTDVIAGRTFLGEPLRDDDGWDTSKILLHGGRNMVPFWLDGAFAGPFKAAPVMMAGEFMGLSSYEISLYDRLSAARQGALANSDLGPVKQYRDEVRKAGGKLYFRTAPSTLQKYINNSVPEVHLLAEEFDKEYGITVSGDAREMREYYKEKHAFDLIQVQELALVSQGYEEGRMDMDGVGKAYSFAAKARRQRNQELLEKYTGVEAHFSDLRNAQNDEDWHGFQGDLYYYQLQATKNDKIFERDDGTWDFERSNWAEQGWWQANPEAAPFRDYITNKERNWFKSLPVIQRYVEGITAIQDSQYFDMHEVIYKQGSKERIMAIEMKDISSDYKDTLVQAYPDTYGKVWKELKEAREEMLKRNPILDAWIVEILGNNPKNIVNIRANLKERLLFNRRYGLANTPHKDRFTISATGDILVASREGNENPYVPTRPSY